MAQVEVSRTIVSGAPRHARTFFEALVTGNLDLGRPDTIEIISGRRVRADTASEFKTKIVSRGTEVTVNAASYDLAADGLAFAVFYTKVHDRVPAPPFAAGEQAPPQLRAALTTIQRHIDDRFASAKQPMAA